MQTKQFTPEEVSAYLGDPIVTSEHDVSYIQTAIRVIGKYEPNVEDRNVEMVEAAMTNITEWAEDYGVTITFDVAENEV